MFKQYKDCDLDDDLTRGRVHGIIDFSSEVVKNYELYVA